MNKSFVARVARLLLVGVFAAAPLALVAGCNAVKGAGKDLQESSDNTKEAIQDAAN